MEKVKVIRVYEGKTHIATIEAYGDSVDITKAVGLSQEYYSGSFTTSESTCGEAERLTASQLRAIFKDHMADMFPNMDASPRFGRASMVGIDRHFGL